MKKTNILMYGSMILATTLGVYGQDISYYIARNTVEISPVYYLVILTMTSIFLFLITPILAYKLNNKHKVFSMTVSINGFIGILTSAWSLFVLAMWWS